MPAPARRSRRDRRTSHRRPAVCGHSTRAKRLGEPERRLERGYQTADVALARVERIRCGAQLGQAIGDDQQTVGIWRAEIDAGISIRRGGANGSVSVALRRTASIQRRSLSVSSGASSRQRAAVARPASLLTSTDSSSAASLRNISSSVTSSPSARRRAPAPARSRSHTMALPFRKRAGRTSRTSEARTSTKREWPGSQAATRFSTSTTAPSRRSGAMARKWNATDHVLRSTRAPGWRVARAHSSFARSSTSSCEASAHGCQAPASRRHPPCSATSTTSAAPAKNPSSTSRGRPLITATVMPGEAARSAISATSSGPGRALSGVDVNGISVPSRSTRMASGVQRASASQ